ncbi:hypothetical protein [Robertmurraya massiliosenegalensis]|uniref:hypothetical protein n=1 Tax=Robertmurraya massiliosenegalensis TaxID=1287657 RepID=UPI0002E81367|nr:hypothetical protein [Robertmurraya massiliosenegalensis]
MEANKKQYREQLISIGRKELGISDKEAQQALDKLIKLGLVKITKKGVVIR